VLPSPDQLLDQKGARQSGHLGTRAYKGVVKSQNVSQNPLIIISKCPKCSSLASANSPDSCPDLRLIPECSKLSNLENRGMPPNESLKMFRKPSSRRCHRADSRLLTPPTRASLGFPTNQLRRSEERPELEEGAVTNRHRTLGAGTAATRMCLRERGTRCPIQSRFLPYAYDVYVTCFVNGATTDQHGKGYRYQVNRQICQIAIQILELAEQLVEQLPAG
jgi:hypothetical protein